jgi:toxin ParE1/3/4
VVAKMVEIVWSNNARERLKEILEYHNNQNPEYSSKLIRKIQDQQNLLKEFPQMGRLVPEKNSQNIREVFLENCRLIYFYENSTVSIVTIIHFKQNFKDNFL